MSNKNVDERVVRIDLDNSRLEEKTPKTLEILKKLENALTFKKTAETADQNIKKINKSVESVKMDKLANGIDSLNSKLSVVGVATATAVSNITTNLINSIRGVSNKFGLGPMMDGFSEYEKKMASIRTMLASSERPLSEVKNTLEDLNQYADKTIYSFSDMTESIGKFTNAGVSLDKATLAIKGISNEAALAGANANEASRAMYNFAQALSQGSVKYIDWKSIENANMATVEFKQQLIDTAVELGTLKKVSADSYKSVTKNARGATSDSLNAIEGFNDSLQYQWMTTDVLVKTLGKYADETTKIGQKAYEAATKVRTFSDLMDTTQEAIGSKWGEAFELVIGDYDQATEVFTALSKVMDDLVEKSLGGTVRVLREWSELGGRIELIEACKNAYQALLSIMKPVHDAFANVFPPLTGNTIFYFTALLRNFTENLTLSAENAKSLQDVFEGLFSIIDIWAMVTTRGLSFAFNILSKVLEACGWDVIDLAAAVGRGIRAFDKWLWENNYVNSALNFTSDKIKTIIGYLIKFKDAIRQSGAAQYVWAHLQTIASVAISSFGGILKEAIKIFTSFVLRIRSMHDITPRAIFTEVIQLFKNLAELFTTGSDIAATAAKNSIGVIGSAISMIDKTIGGKIGGILNILNRFADGLFNSASKLGIGFGDIAAVLAGIGVVKLGKSIDRLIDVVDNFSKFPKSLADVVDSITGLINNLSESAKMMAKAASFSIKMEGIKSLATAILIVAGAIAIIAMIPSETFARGAITIGAIAAFFIGIVALSGILEKKGFTGSFEKMSLAASSIGTALLFISFAIGRIAKIRTDRLVVAGVVLTLITGIFTLSAAAVSAFDRGGGSIKSMIGMAGAMVILSYAFDKLSKVRSPLKGLINFTAAIAELVVIDFIMRKLNPKSAVTAILFAVSLGTFALGLSFLGTMPFKNILKGLGYMYLIMLSMVSLMGVNKLLDGKGLGKNFGKNAISMAASLAIFALSLKIIGSISPETLLKALPVMAAFSSIMIAIMAFSQKAGKNSAKAAVLILAVSGAIVTMSIAATALGHVDSKKLLKGVAAVSALTLATGEAMKLATSGQQGAVKIAGLAVIIGELVICAVVLANMPAEKVLTNVGVLSALMFSVGLVIKSLEGMDISGKAIAKIALLGVIFMALGGIMAGIVSVIGDNSTANDVVQIAAAMGIAITAVSGCIVIISKSGEISKGIIGKVAIMAAIMSAVGLALSAISSAFPNTQGLMELVLSISVAMTVISALTALIGFIGKFIEPSAVLKGIEGMGLVTLAMGVLAGVFSALAYYLPEDAEEILDRAAVLSEKVGAVLGKLIGGFAGGIMAGAGNVVMGALPAWGESMAEFGKKLSEVPPEAGESAKNIATAILALTTADLISGIISLFGGKVDIAKFADSVPKLGEGISGFAKSVKDVKNWDGVKSASEALKTVTEAAATIPNEGGLAALFAGENDINEFCRLLSDAMPWLKLANASAITVKDWSGIRSAGEALGSIAEAAGKIPNSNGLVAKITGDNDIKGFAERLSDALPDLKAANDIASKSGKWTDLINAASALTSIANAATKIPNDAGLVARITGENDIKTFGEQLANFGPNLRLFALAVSMVSDWESPKAAAKCLAEIAKVASTIPNQGGWVQAITGNSSLDVFGTNLALFGSALYSYSTSVAGITNMDQLVKSVDIIKAFASVSKELPKTGGLASVFGGDKSFKSLGKGLKDFGDAVYSFAKKTQNVSLASTISLANNVKYVVERLRNAGIEESAKAVKNYIKAINELGKAIIKELNGSWNEAKRNTEKAGQDIGDSLANGIRSRYNIIKQAGVYLMDGLIKGVQEGKNTVTSIMSNTANDTIGAFKKEAEIHSPSKKMTAVGAALIDGLSKGIDTSKFKPIKSMKDTVTEMTQEVTKVDLSAPMSTIEKSMTVPTAKAAKSASTNSKSVKESVKKAKTALEEFSDSVRNAIEGSTKLFDEFTEAEKTSVDTMSANIKSQISGIEEWYNGLQILAARGVTKKLLKELAKAGPETLNYVRAMTTATDKELKNISKLYLDRLKLNTKGTQAIVESFYSGGVSAATAYSKGLTNELDKITNKAKKKLKETVSYVNNSYLNLNAIGTAADAASWSIRVYWSEIETAANKMEYANDVLRVLAGKFYDTASSAKQGQAQIKAMTKEIEKYVMALYRQTDAYKENAEVQKTANAEVTRAQKAYDNAAKKYADARNKRLSQIDAAIKANKKRLAKLKKQNSAAAKIQIGALKAQNSALKKERENIIKNNVSAMNATLKGYALAVQAATNALSTAQENLTKVQEQIADGIKQAYQDMYNSIYSSISSSLDILNTSLDNHVDIFSKFESSATKYSDAERDLAYNKEKLTKLQTEEADLEEQIAELRAINTVSARKEMETLEDQLESLRSEIDNVTNAIEENQQTMEENSKVTKETILANMASQVNGVLEWRQKLNQLGKTDISSGLLEQLEQLGPSAIEYVDAFIQMTAEELKQANNVWDMSKQLSAEEFLSGMQKDYDKAKEFEQGIERMTVMGFSQNLIQELVDKGVESLDYVRMFASMTKEQMEEFALKYERALATPGAIAVDLLADLAHAGEKTVVNNKAVSDSLLGVADSLDACYSSLELVDKAVEVSMSNLGENWARGKAGMFNELSNLLDDIDAGVRLYSSDLESYILRIAEVAPDLAEGLRQGIDSSLGETFANTFVEKFAEALGIHSPSTVMMQMGQYIVDGLNLGIGDSEKTVKDTIGGLTGLIVGAFSEDIDFEPVITPVLNLDEIQNGLNNTAFNINGITTASDLSGEISARFDERQKELTAIINPSDINKLITAIRDIDGGNTEINNEFNIGSSDPRGVAQEVSREMQRQVERRKLVWA